MVGLIVIFSAMIAGVGVFAMFFWLRDSEHWLVRRITGRRSPQVDTEELELLEQDRAGDT